MIRRIEARPHAYVAQELVNLSQAPTWSRDHERRLLARSVGLRAYAVATPRGYQVMPGGLSRVAGSAQAMVISMQRGGASKDTWVLADGVVDTFSLLKPVLGKSDLVRSGNNLSSRVVESLFWFGRYTERFDDTARLLRVALSRLVDAGREPTPELASVVELCVFAGIVAAEKAAEKGDAAAGVPVETRLTQAIFDSEADDSLAAAIRRLIWSASHVRERLSVDHWHSLNRLQRTLQSGKARSSELGETLAFLDQVLLVSSSLTGFPWTT